MLPLSLIVVETPGLHPPAFGQKVSEFGGVDQFADFQPPIPFVNAAGGAPVPAVGSAPKELQGLLEGGLIALSDQDVVTMDANSSPCKLSFCILQ